MHGAWHVNSIGQFVRPILKLIVTLTLTALRAGAARAGGALYHAALRRVKSCAARDFNLGPVHMLDKVNGRRDVERSTVDAWMVEAWMVDGLTNNAFK